MTSSREKGLDYSREVKKILEGIGHKVDGPFYGIAFYNGKMNSIHRDVMGVYDLLSFDGSQLIGHQVSSDRHKSEKIKAFQRARVPGWVWCRFSNDDHGTGYQVYIVDGERVIEAKMVYGLWKKPKKEAGGQRRKGLANCLGAASNGGGVNPASKKGERNGLIFTYQQANGLREGSSFRFSQKWQDVHGSQNSYWSGEAD